MKNNERNFLVSLLLFVIILMSILSFSSEAVEDTVIYPSKSPFDVIVNGNILDKNNKQFPLIFYKNIIHIPVTNELGDYVGFEYHGSKGFRTILKSKVKNKDWKDIEKKYNPMKFNVVRISNFHLYLDNGKKTSDEINQAEEPYPFLHTDGSILYFPLTWKFVHEVMGWDYEFDPSKGLIINTEK